MRVKGFTLIELLVVMAIMAVFMAVVGPWSIERYEKLKASHEWYRFVIWSQSLQQQAFLTGQSIHLQLDGKTSNYYVGQELQHQDWQFVFFTPQQLTLNTNGFSDAEQIHAVVAGRDKFLAMNKQAFLIKGPTH